MNGFYRTILKGAWQMVWRHKGLWLFGVFAALVAEEIEAVIRNYAIYANQSLSIERFREFFSADTFGGLFDLYRNLIVSSPGSSIVSLLLTLVIIVLIVWLIVISQSAIMYAANALTKKRTYQWNEAFSAGIVYFWPVLTMNLILKVVDYTMLVLVGLLLSWVLQTSAFLFGGVLVLFTFVVSMLLSILGKYALGYIVLKNDRVTISIKNAWKLFKANWIISVEASVLFFLISTVIGLALFLVTVLIAVPFLLLIWLFSVAELAAGTQILFYVGIIIILLIIVVVGGALSAFRYSGWTMIFLRLIDGKAESKIVRWADSITKRIDKRRTT